MPPTPLIDITRMSDEDIIATLSYLAYKADAAFFSDNEELQQFRALIDELEYRFVIQPTLEPDRPCGAV